MGIKPVPTALLLSMSLPSSPQAISHDFPSVHLVTVSPPSTLSSLQSRSFPTKLSPKLFPTVSPPATLSSLPSRSLPTEQLFPTASRPSISLLPNGALPKLFPTVLRPPCRRFNLAPSNGALPKLFPTVSPSTLSSLPSCSLPTEPSPSYFPQFPLRPPSRRFRIAPLAAKSTKRERKHRRCFWEKHLKISKDKCQEMTSK